VYTRTYSRYPSKTASLNDLYTKLLQASRSDGSLTETLKIHYKGLSNPSGYFEPLLANLVDKAKDNLPKTEEGLIDAKALIEQYIAPSNELLALYWSFREPSRSAVVEDQRGNPNYCSLVPVIPAAFKRYANINYSSWDMESLQFLIAPNLYEAMTVPEIPAMTPEEVLIEREEALRTAATGKMKPAASTYTLYPKRNESKLRGLPMLTRIMICQTWCAHPSTRTKYMILDPMNWDNMPQPLEDSNPLFLNNMDGPWNLKWSGLPPAAVSDKPAWAL
jgi:hypothetical protein